MKIALADIGVHERYREDLGDIEDLARDLLTNGQITPIAIRPADQADRDSGFEQPYMLVAGGRRHMAARLAGWREIEAHQLAELPPRQRLILELHENLKRKALTWQEETNLKAEIHKLNLEENPAQKAWETAREFHDSAANFSKDLKVAAAMAADPSLAEAGSKRAAYRMLEMKEHIERVTNQSEQAASRVQSIQESVVTADARAFLGMIPKGSVDLMYSDPLWGIDYFSTGNKHVVDHDESIHLSDYDDSEQNMQDVMTDCIPLMIEALKPEGWLALHCGYDAYHTWKQYIEDYCLTHRCYTDQQEACFPGAGDCRFLLAEAIPWIWYRPNSQNRSRNPDIHEDNRYEYLLIVNRGEAKLYKQHEGNVLVHDAEYGMRIHAMQKPLSLCQDVVSRLTLFGMLVVDPFFGSGALLAGAASLGRRIAGCDLNPSLLQPAHGYIAREAR